MKKIICITVTDEMRSEMLSLSKKLKDCPRPVVGSISHFANVAIKLLIEDMKENNS